MAQPASSFGHVGRKALRVTTHLLALPALTLTALTLALLFGTVSIAPSDTAHVLLRHLGIPASPVQPNVDAIIWSIRMPRVAATALVGVALAVAGTLFQAVLRNPLADPYVIGTSAGAQLGVSIMLLLPLQTTVFGFGPVQGAAFVGAVVTVMAVYLLARTAGRTPVVTLLLAGFVVSSFLISFSSFLISISSHSTQILAWTMGSTAVSEFSQIGLTAPIVLISVVLATALAHQLDVITLGEEHAGHLGIRVERLKLLAITLGALLTALAVSLAGVVAFVGLVVPHAARLLYGPAHARLIPTSALAGATFVVSVDLLARTLIAPTEIPLGVMTAVVGAPFFLYLLRHSRRHYEL